MNLLKHNIGNLIKITIPLGFYPKVVVKSKQLVGI